MIDSCPACTGRFQVRQSARLAFDLYPLGSQNDVARIRRRVVFAGIAPTEVSTRLVIPYHDAGRWILLDLDGELPAAIRKETG